MLIMPNKRVHKDIHVYKGTKRPNKAKGKELPPLYILTHSQKISMKACLIAWSSFSLFSKALLFLSFRIIQNKNTKK